MNTELNNRFAAAGFPVAHQGGNVWAGEMVLGDRIILITPDDFDAGWIVGLHSDVDCVAYQEVPDIGADTVGTALLFAQRLAVACYVRHIARAMGS